MGNDSGMIALSGALGLLAGALGMVAIHYLQKYRVQQSRLGHNNSRQGEDGYAKNRNARESVSDHSQRDDDDLAAGETLLKKFTDNDTDDLQEGEVAVPFDEFSDRGGGGLWGWFTWRQLWAFTGPGWLLTLAYLDPGNIEADLQLGATSGYSLFWVLLLVHILAFFLQMLAARIGLVTGKSLSRMCRDQYQNIPRFILWIMAEFAVIGSDIQEVIGSALAIHILSGNTVPLAAGVMITVVDCFIFLLLEAWSIRYLEGAFAFLVLMMAVTFAIVFFHDRPPAKYVMTAVGTVGAVIMPHNLFLHSSLVLSRKVPRKDEKRVRVAIYYNMVEIGIALFAAFLINLFVVGVFAHSFFHDRGATEREKDNCSSDDIGLFSAGYCLSEKYGQDVISKIWALGLLASGQASTMSGTYAGQKIMEGFLNVPVKPWQRVTITRMIALGPALLASFSLQEHQLDVLNQWLNILQSLQLPFALVPVILLSSSYAIMGTFANNKKHLTIYITIAVTVILFNAVLVAVNLYSNVVLAFFSSFIGVLYLFFLYMLTSGKFESSQSKAPQASQDSAFVELTEKVTPGYLLEQEYQ